MAAYKTFQEEIKGKKPGTPEYYAIVEKWQQADLKKRKDTQDKEYCYQASVKIIKLLGPTKFLNASRLMYLKKDQLNDIGKAARELYEVMIKAGISPR